MKTKKKEKNKGFSLVELIIVIAIMVVVAGIIAPRLLKYLEKSKVSADLNSLESIYEAVAFASMDPEVQSEPASMSIIDHLANDASPHTLSWLMDESNKNTKFTKQVLDTLGWESSKLASRSQYMSEFQSAHTENSDIFMQYKGDFVNPLAMWIKETDASGNKDVAGNTAATYQDITNEIAIY